MLCDRNLPTAINDFDAYIESREKKKEPTNNDVCSTVNLVQQSCGKRSHEEAFAYSDQCEKRI